LIRSFINRNYSSLKGPARKLALLHLLDSVGTGLFIGGSAVYFITVKHLPGADVGLGFSLFGLSGFFSTIVMGLAADRIGVRRLLFLSLLALAGAYCLYPVIDSLPAFFAVIALVGALELGSGPLFQTMVMELVPEEDRVSARAALRSLFNAGFSTGALLAAIFIGIGGVVIQVLPLANALSFLLAAAIVLRLPARSAAGPAAGSSGKRAGIRRFRALRDKSFLSVVGASSLLAMHSAVLVVGIPLWLVRYHIVPRSLVPAVFLLNTILVILFQVRAARGSDTLDGAVVAARKAGLISAAACIVLVIGRLMPTEIISVIALLSVLLFTLAELWQSASAFSLGFGLAPDSARSEYLGAFNIHVVIQATIGPAIVSFLVVEHGSAGWLGMSLIFLAGAIAIGPAVHWAQRQRAPEAPEAYEAPEAHDEVLLVPSSGSSGADDLSSGADDLERDRVS
jgi:MFS family permease